MNKQVYTYDEKLSLAIAEVVPPVLKSCYHNALSVLAAYEHETNWRYVEGYLLDCDLVTDSGKPLALQHAWVIDIVARSIYDTTATLHESWNRVYHPLLIYKPSLLEECGYIPNVPDDAGELFGNKSVWLTDMLDVRRYFNYQQAVLMGVRKENPLAGASDWINVKLGNKSVPTGFDAESGDCEE